MQILSLFLPIQSRPFEKSRWTVKLLFLKVYEEQSWEWLLEIQANVSENVQDKLLSTCRFEGEASDHLKRDQSPAILTNVILRGYCTLTKN